MKWSDWRAVGDFVYITGLACLVYYGGYRNGYKDGQQAYWELMNIRHQDSMREAAAQRVKYAGKR